LDRGITGNCWAVRNAAHCGTRQCFLFTR
jgi:hypothetical protein